MSAQISVPPLPVEKFLSTSLYPRPIPPENRLESYHYTVKPKALQHPPFIPFRSKVVLGYGRSVAHIVKGLPSCSHKELSSRMTGLKQKTEHLLSLDNRLERLQYISDLLAKDNDTEETLQPIQRFSQKLDSVEILLTRMRIQRNRETAKTIKKRAKTFANARRFLSIGKIRVFMITSVSAAWPTESFLIMMVLYRRC